jgi:hypothetical protein
MLRGHIVCQRDRQAACLLRNKCIDRAAQRPYVRLRPLAYVTGDMSRGSIGPPPERGVGASAAWFGHVSAPDPCLALTKAWVFFSLASRGPTESGPDPSWGVLDPSQGSGLHLWRFWTPQGSPVCASRGPAPSCGGLDPLSPPWSISSFMATQRPWSRPRGRVRCLFATRLNIAAWTSHPYTVVTGTPFPGYWQEPLTFYRFNPPSFGAMLCVCRVLLWAP